MDNDFYDDYDCNAIITVGDLIRRLRDSGFLDRLEKMSVQAQVEFKIGVVGAVTDKQKSIALSREENECKPIYDFLHRMAKEIGDDLVAGEKYPGMRWMNVYLDTFCNENAPVICYYKEQPKNYQNKED